ncbi:MAG: serpin family protein [Firmicutes bacterium]|nr:serpin family protein [Bacillota bacterium]
MKKEKLFEVLGDLDEREVKAAREYGPSEKVQGTEEFKSVKVKTARPTWKRWIAIAVCAVLLIAAFTRLPALRSGGSQEDYPAEFIALAAEYPEAVCEGMSADKYLMSEESYEWWQEQLEKIEASSEAAGRASAYSSDIMQKILAAEDDNTVCSPLNTYIALSMLAEVADGNTRAEILEALGAQDLDSLRNDVKALWETNYINTPSMKSTLANSFWLNGRIKFNDETLQTLCDDYYASSFRGEMGSEEMDKALQDWTDKNTGGLLKEYTQDMKTYPDIVMELLSTIYYKASWLEKFYEEENQTLTFHGTKGDTEAEMMQRKDFMKVYRTDKFTATGLSVGDDGCGTMYFYLPKEGVDVNELLGDEDVIKAATQLDDDDWSYPEVKLLIPKFKVSEKTDLLEILEELGIKDAMQPGIADFSPLTPDSDELYLAKAEHAAMVEINEEGVTGAAYTELALGKGGPSPMETIDLTFDRPFMFVLAGADGSILFSGIVRNID